MERTVIKWIKSLSLLAVLDATVGAGCATLSEANSSSPWLMVESTSAKHFGTAVFLDQEGWQGSDTYFFVQDQAAPTAKPVRVGASYASDGPYKFQQAVWSGDGSVIAVRVKAGQSAGHGFSRYDGEFWIDAYDFRRHHAVTEGKSIGERSKAVERLLAGRGGKGSIAAADLSNTGKPQSNQKARAYDTSFWNYNDIFPAQKQETR